MLKIFGLEVWRIRSFFRFNGKRYIKVRSAGMNRKKNAKSLFFHGIGNGVKFDIGDWGGLTKYQLDVKI